MDETATRGVKQPGYDSRWPSAVEADRTRPALARRGQVRALVPGTIPLMSRPETAPGHPAAKDRRDDNFKRANR